MNPYLIPFNQCDRFLSRVKEKADFFSKTSKNIIFIEPYGAALSLLQHGIEAGYNIIIYTAQSDLRTVPDAILKTSALNICLDTVNEPILRQVTRLLHSIIPIHAVIPGFEYFVSFASILSADLQLPAIRPQQIECFRRKDKMRLFLKKSGISVPKFQIIHHINDIEQAIHYIGFPSVIKPVDASGSVYVKCVHNMAEARSAAQRILQSQDVLWGHHLSRCLLLEEYISGKEYSAEGTVQRGQVLHFSITEKMLSDESEFVEIGHIVNVPLEQTLKTRIKHYVTEILSVLKADYCPFHVEFRITSDGQPMLMEIAARLAGDKIGDLISLAKNVRYFDYIYAAYLGEALPLFLEEEECFAGIRFFYRPEVESYHFIKGTESIESQQINNLAFYYQPGESIPVFPKPLRRLGHVVMKSTEYEYLNKALVEIDNQISFE